MRTVFEAGDVVLHKITKKRYIVIKVSGEKVIVSDGRNSNPYYYETFFDFELSGE